MTRLRVLAGLAAVVLLAACGIDSETSATLGPEGAPAVGSGGDRGVGGSEVSPAGAGGSAGHSGSAGKGGGAGEISGGSGGSSGSVAGKGGSGGSAVGTGGADAGAGGANAGTGGAGGTEAGTGGAGTGGSGGSNAGGTEAGTGGSGGTTAGTTSGSAGAQAGSAGTGGDNGDAGAGDAGASGAGAGGASGNGGAETGGTAGTSGAGNQGGGGSGGPVCGNGIVETGEECDGIDGTIGGFTCLDNCLVDCDEPGISFRDPTTGACYFVVVDQDSNGITWDQAKTGCENLSSRLATFADTSLRDRVKKGLAPNGSRWVGARQQEKTGSGCNGVGDSWTWLTGETVPNNGAAWASSQPNDGDKCENNDQNCGRTDSSSDFRLNDAGCDETRPGICVRLPQP
jgi:hypothetical protein